MAQRTGTFGLLSELLSHLEAYAQEHREQDMSLPAFMFWLQRQMLKGANPYSMPEPEMKEATGGQVDIMLTILITYLYRYAKHYGKKALSGSPLSTLDEFSFLATLRFRGDLTKTELIQIHLLELTSGIEIIKRLAKQGFVEVFRDPQDRRSRRVRLTPAGEAVFNDMMPQMNLVAKIVSGNLGAEDIGKLMPLLHQLNDFHAAIHEEDRRTDLVTITEKYLEPG